jgi:hypothetical protein
MPHAPARAGRGPAEETALACAGLAQVCADTGDVDAAVAQFLQAAWVYSFRRDDRARQEARAAYSASAKARYFLDFGPCQGSDLILERCT